MTDFAKTRAFFDLPDGVIYLDGNSLGPLPRHAAERVTAVMRDEWGGHLIRAWNSAGWMDLPERLGARIGRLIGAEPDTVTLGDTLSVKIYQALAAALTLRPDRRVILSDSGNFPSDLYVAQGLIRTLGAGHELRVVAPEAVEESIDEDTAVVMLTHVDYRTGRLHDMAALTARARAVGALTVWDLAHSTGAVPVDLQACGADFAAGCTYKYLNGGPGAPGFIYAAPRHHSATDPALSGWLGHAAPFEFDPSYRPAPGIGRLRIGTPPVLALAALDAAMDVWDGVSMADVRQTSQDLSEHMIALVDNTCPELTLASPADRHRRGSQLSFRHSDGYAVMQALIARGVIGDFRAPDLIRFGLTPLYINAEDITAAVSILSDVLSTKAWDRPEYHKRAAVT